MSAKHRSFCCLCLAIVISLYACDPLFAEPVTVFAPSHASIENSSEDRRRDEIDVLMALMDPFEHTGIDMDRPQLFAVIRHFGKGEQERKDLLGDLEEIRYQDTRAWGANVAVEQPGLYQFLLEDKPRWSEKANRYVRQQAKVMIPVATAGELWHVPAGQHLEIVPSTRPYGLFAPDMFSGTLLLDGKAAGDTLVYAGNVSTDKITYPTSWHKLVSAKTGSDGSFSLLLNRPGWWFIESSVPGEPLKGQDGENRETRDSTVFWLYVDPMPALTPAARTK